MISCFVLSIESAVLKVFPSHRSVQFQPRGFQENRDQDGGHVWVILGECALGNPYGVVAKLVAIVSSNWVISVWLLH
jgi:hypothetical protein